MGRRGAQGTEIVRRADDPSAEVMLPNAVGHHPGRERILGRSQPVGQGDAAPGGFRVGRRRRKRRLPLRQNARKPRLDLARPGCIHCPAARRTCRAARGPCSVTLKANSVRAASAPSTRPAFAATGDTRPPAASRSDARPRWRLTRPDRSAAARGDRRFWTAAPAENSTPVKLQTKGLLLLEIFHPQGQSPGRQMDHGLPRIAQRVNAVVLQNHSAVDEQPRTVVRIEVEAIVRLLRNDQCGGKDEPKRSVRAWPGSDRSGSRADCRLFPA